MADTFSINKQSKLFQKFINLKNNKSKESPSPEHKEQSQNVSDNEPKQNQYTIMNRTDRSVTELAPRVNTVNTSLLFNRNGQEKNVNSSLCNVPSNSKMVDNSLNYKNGLGLDQILKRAIEKVRQGKIDDLFDKKKEHQSSKQTRQEQSFLCQNQEQSAQNDEISEIQKLKQQKSEQHTKLNLLVHSGIYNKATYKLSTQIRNTDQNQQLKIKLDELLRQNQQLTKEVQIATMQLQLSKQKENSLFIQNKKLKSEINKEVKHSEDLLQQNRHLQLQIRELQHLVSQKQNQVKQKNDDANYWKNQYQLQKSNIENIKDMLKKAEEDVQRERIQIFSTKKDKEQKEAKIIELNLEIAKLKEENSLAKQYLYELTIKLYNTEQQVSRLRYGLLKDQRQMENQQAKTKFETSSLQCQQPSTRSTPIQRTKTVRNRQFNRQRDHRNIIVDSSDFKKSNSVVKLQEKSHLQNSLHKDTKIPQKKVEIPQFAQTDTSRQLRLATIQQQLKQIKQMAFINGKMRRRKIQLERQLQQLKF